MENKYDSFPQAAKAVILEYGQDVISDVKFLNILSDVISFDEVSGVKNVLRKLLSDGYGKEILSSSKSEMWEIKLKMLSSKLILDNGFRENITNYIFESIAYGLGLKETMPDSKSIKTNNVEGGLDLLLRRMKTDYITLLEEKIVASEVKSGFYPTNVKSDIYELKEKIMIVGKAVGKDESQWCDQTIKEIKEKYYVEPQITGHKGFFKRLFGLS